MDGNNTNVGTVNGTMTLTDNATGKSIELPVIEGSIGPKVIDVRKLYAQTGYFTYDPGFMATAACRSSITYIDGDEGILLYRGYPIQELADKSDFLEVAYLLLNGELPTAEAEGAVRLRHHPPHDGARAAQRPSSAASAATRTRWRCCAASSARCRPSITTRPTSTIRTSGWSPRTG